MTLFSVLSIIAVLCIIIFSGVSIEDFSNFFNSLFDVTKESEVSVIETNSVTKEDIKNMWESKEVERKKEISNTQRLFNWCLLIAFIVLILFGITFFTGSSGVENVDSSNSAEAISNSVEAISNSESADIPSDSYDSYDSDISNEAAVWYNELPAGEVGQTSAETKSLEVFLDEESLD